VCEHFHYRSVTSENIPCWVNVAEKRLTELEKHCAIVCSMFTQNIIATVCLYIQRVLVAPSELYISESSWQKMCKGVPAEGLKPIPVYHVLTQQLFAG